MKKTTKFLMVIMVMTMFFITSCATNGGRNSSQTDDKQTNPLVAVSIVPQETFVKAVAGDLVDVVVMIPPGKSPVNYAPSPQELQDFSDASIYFAIGVPTEEVNILSKAEDINPELHIVHLEKTVAEIYPEREFSPGKRDQHIWLSPKRVSVIIETIADELSKLDPANAETYRSNAESYQDQLVQLDRELKAIVEKMQNKTFIVYHPSFGYFADDYGLTMVALEKGGKEATPQELEKTIELAKRENIKVIFYQEEIDSRQSRAFAEEIGGTSQKVAPLAPDYIDNMKRMAEAFASVVE